MGNGNFVLYAHLIPGGAAVAEGDYVQQGQLLGRLRNSGNTDAPHLHFQIMDSASTLNTHDLPFVFDRMVYQGRLVCTLSEIEQAVFSSKAPVLDTRGSGLRTLRMPITLDVVGFK